MTCPLRLNPSCQTLCVNWREEDQLYSARKVVSGEWKRFGRYSPKISPGFKGVKLDPQHVSSQPKSRYSSASRVIGMYFPTSARRRVTSAWKRLSPAVVSPSVPALFPWNHTAGYLYQGTWGRPSPSNTIDRAIPTSSHGNGAMSSRPPVTLDRGKKVRSSSSCPTNNWNFMGPK